MRLGTTGRSKRVAERAASGLSSGKDVGVIQVRSWLRLVTSGLGLALVLGPFAPAADPDPKEQVVAYNRRTFKVPVTIPTKDVARLKEVQLLAATGGGDWEMVGTTSPDRPYFLFTAKTDGQYWFAARTVDKQGRLFPPNGTDIEPNMRVMIDTKKPEMSIEPRPRRGNVASIEWDVTDEALDLTTLAFEYQVDNSTDWIPITIRRPSRIGVESWDAGTSEPLKVRGTVADKAKNRQVVVASVPGGGASADGAVAPTESADPNVPPPIGTFASTDVSRSPAAASPSPKRSRAAGNEVAGAYDPYSAPSGDRGAGDPGAGGASRSAKPAPAAVPIATPKFALQYEVDDAGPNGAQRVELFVTSDGGQTWTSKGEDPDRKSPFQVDLGGEGRYGLKLVASSAANQGDQPPVPGEIPETSVEVDTSGPAIAIDQPQVRGNQLLITWQASDPHPAKQPVMISIKADGPGNNWSYITPTPVENTGQYSWLISAKCPPKIRVRIDIRDGLGNLSFAETSESSPVIVDLTKPRGRITKVITNPAR